METGFGVLEVLQIAEKLEHNGSQFYKRMAKLFIPDSRRWNLCQDLADWRAGRELTLAQRRKLFYEQEARLKPIDASDYFQIHPDVMADLTVFANKLYPPHMPTGHENPSEIVKDAIAKTEEAITFYRGLKDFTQNQEARAVLDQIIEEEKRYICILAESPYPAGRSLRTYEQEKNVDMEKKSLLQLCPSLLIKCHTS